MYKLIFAYLKTINNFYFPEVNSKIMKYMKSSCHISQIIHFNNNLMNLRK